MVVQNMSVLDHLIYLLKHSLIDQEATEENMEQLNGSELGKECSKLYIVTLLT